MAGGEFVMRFVMRLDFTGLNPRALKKQIPAFAGKESPLFPLVLSLLPAKAGACTFKARGFSPVK